MKKNFKYAILSAIALVGAVNLTSCSSSDDVDLNPTYDGESVQTQFSISLPSNINAQTRMTDANVQKEDNSFLGMQDIVLMPFASKPTETTDKLLGDPIELDDIGTTLTALSGTTKYKVYSSVTVPLGTSAFLFYAQTYQQENRSQATKFSNGSTVMTDPETAGTADYTFVPEQIFTGTNTIGNNLAAYLTQIAGAKTGNIEWGDFGSYTNEGLQNLYTSFTSMTAGSSFSVQRAVTDLYNSLKNNTDELSQAIVTAITTTYASVSGTSLEFDASINGYPANLKLPEGAAKVTFNSGTFTANSLASYVYPAALWYRANTTIQVSNQKQANDEGVYSGKTTWDENSSTGVLALYDGTSVTSTTRSIALKDVIQYAVGRLDVTVKCEGPEGTKLLDYYGNEITVDDDGFPVSAVLIGGQKAVDFEFTNPAGTEYTIYDKELSGVYAKSGSTMGSNCTLALETASEIDVNVSIELTNNTGYDFYGQGGQIIPAGSKFYLTAPLAANSATATNKQVFKQDYYTSANFTIKVGTLSSGINTFGLGAASNTIPDLRTPQLELGMAVDLQWQQGHTYSVNL